MDTALLLTYGIDYESGLARCMNDEAFYKDLLSMFLRDDNFQRAKTALESGDMAALFTCMHTLKGVCGNIDLKALYVAVNELVELLRGKNAAREDVLPAFAAVQAAYDKTAQGIALVLQK